MWKAATFFFLFNAFNWSLKVLHKLLETGVTSKWPPVIFSVIRIIFKYGRAIIMLDCFMIGGHRYNASGSSRRVTSRRRGLAPLFVVRGKLCRCRRLCCGISCSPTDVKVLTVCDYQSL